MSILFEDMFLKGFAEVLGRCGDLFRFSLSFFSRFRF